MRDELEKKLYDAYPALYALWHQGFKCADGWYDLIDRLSFRIAKIIATNDKLDPKLYTVVQVKEKFGGLRFYMNRQTVDMAEEILRAGEESFKICEICGSEGTKRAGEWIIVMCDACEAERLRRQGEQRRRWARRDSRQMDID